MRWRVQVSFYLPTDVAEPAEMIHAALDELMLNCAPWEHVVDDVDLHIE